MRVPSILFALVIGVAASAQKDRIDFARFDDSKDKDEITETYKQNFKRVFDVFPAVVLGHLYVQKDFAFLIGKVSDPSGGAVDFAKFNAARQKDVFPHRGQETRALLKRAAGKWQVLALLVSPEDYSWACWWAEYNAPKEIFDYTDYCR